MQSGQRWEVAGINSLHDVLNPQGVYIVKALLSMLGASECYDFLKNPSLQVIMETMKGS